MKCPKCQSENPRTRKFCRKCGKKLILVCPKCLFENLLDDMYCGGCGRKVGERPKERGSAQTNGKISAVLPKLQKYRETCLGEAERDYLKSLLAVTEGNIAKACDISGLSRSRLYVLKKKWEV